MPPLKVVCIKYGDKYSAEYVLALQEAVSAHLSLPHTFTCYTEQPVPGCECAPLLCSYEGWWQKIGLFRLEGPWLYFDVDTVIVGSIDWLAEYIDCDLAAMENWGSKPREGPLYEDEISSAVMVSNGNARQIWDNFSQAEADRLHPHGDQTWITEQYRDRITEIPMNSILSYKRHCRHGLSDEASIIAFHGKPMPHEVSDSWVRAHFARCYHPPHALDAR